VRLRAAALLLLALAVPAAAAPRGELIREEAFNYRIAGRLPPGWKQRESKKLVFTFSIDSIPHAYVHFVRERLAGRVDARHEIKARAPSYRFPGAPAPVSETVGRTTWSGREAVLYTHQAQVKGVQCRRRVTALFVQPFWYELIETIYGEKTSAQEDCRRGLELFRNGFRLLAPPLDPALLRDEKQATIESAEYGFKLTKPKGFRRVPVDTGLDPGCRIAFEDARPGPVRSMRVRLFEYGVRQAFDARKWIDIAFNAFAGVNERASREEVVAPRVPGAAQVRAARFAGVRDNRPVRVLVILLQAESGRVLSLRIKTLDKADARLAAVVRTVLESFEVSSARGP